MAATLTQTQDHSRHDTGGQAQTDGSHQRAYQELHAAVLELYRLMGVPRTAPPAAGTGYGPGYTVYGYPAAPAPPFAAAAGQPFTSGGWPVVQPSGYPTVVLPQHGQPVPALLSPHLEAGRPAWIPGYFSPVF